jgi:hypothetical protein
MADAGNTGLRARRGGASSRTPSSPPPPAHSLLPRLLLVLVPCAALAIAALFFAASASQAASSSAAALADAVAASETALAASAAALANAKAESEAAQAALAASAAALANARAESEAALAASAAALADANSAAAAMASRAESPDEAKRVAHRAFLAAEAWRQAEVTLLYANMTDEDWDTAARWKRYAQPDAPERTCAVAGAVAPQVVADIALLLHAVAALPAPLSNRSRSAYLALHAFHTTGLEGNTLTLPETLLTIAGQPLFGGFDARVMPSRAAYLSVTEAMNVAQLWDSLGLSVLPGRCVPPPLDVAKTSVAALVDLNSAITRGTGTPVGLRTRPVAIGHQRVLLPMPDEVPALVAEFLAWLALSVTAAEGADGHALASCGSAAAAAPPSALEQALALACDAHTRYVFVHPFSDGNGRLARTLSALVLQRLGLPAAMVPRSLRAEYMAAVSAATVRRDYAPLAAIHAAAVRRSLACLVRLSRAAAEAPAPLPPASAAGVGADATVGAAAVDAAAVDAALQRGDCELGAAAAAP